MWSAGIPSVQLHDSTNVSVLPRLWQHSLNVRCYNWGEVEISLSERQLRNFVLIQVLLLVTFVYTSLPQYILEISPPPLAVWAIAPLAGIVIMAYNEARKYLIRNHPTVRIVQLIKWWLTPLTDTLIESRLLLCSSTKFSRDQWRRLIDGSFVKSFFFSKLIICHFYYFHLQSKTRFSLISFYICGSQMLQPGVFFGFSNCLFF